MKGIKVRMREDFAALEEAFREADLSGDGNPRAPGFAGPGEDAKETGISFWGLGGR